MQTFNVPTDYNTLSHELRIPLTGILGMAELLKDDHGFSAEQKEEIEVILQSGIRLHAFVEKILAPTDKKSFRRLFWKRTKEKSKNTLVHA